MPDSPHAVHGLHDCKASTANQLHLNYDASADQKVEAVSPPTPAKKVPLLVYSPTSIPTSSTSVTSSSPPNGGANASLHFVPASRAEPAKISPFDVALTSNTPSLDIFDQCRMIDDGRSYSDHELAGPSSTFALSPTSPSMRTTFAIDEGKEGDESPTVAIQPDEVTGRRIFPPIPANISKRPVNRNVNIAVYYRLNRLIASGAFGQIYESVEISTGMTFAIKKINKINVQQAGLCWLKEFSIAEMMNHNNIVHVHQIFDEISHLYIVMELCQGGDLFSFIEALPAPETPLDEEVEEDQEDQNVVPTSPPVLGLHYVPPSTNKAPLNPKKAAKPPAASRVVDAVMDERLAAHLLRQIISSLEHCHSLGVAHRDVKPENFLFAETVPPNRPENAELKLVDFGLGIRNPHHEDSALRPSSSPSGRWIRARHFVGSPHYVAPEVLAYEGAPYDELCDMWSVGVIMFLLLTKNTPTNLMDPEEGSGMKYSNVCRVPELLHEMFEVVQEEHDCCYHHLDQALAYQGPKDKKHHFPVRHRISSKAFCLLSRLLAKNPRDRLSAREALSHAWLVEQNPTAVEWCDNFFLQGVGHHGTRAKMSGLSMNSSRASLLRDLSPRIHPCDSMKVFGQRVPGRPIAREVSGDHLMNESTPRGDALREPFPPATDADLIRGHFTASGAPDFGSGSCSASRRSTLGEDESMAAIGDELMETDDENLRPNNKHLPISNAPEAGKIYLPSSMPCFTLPEQLGIGGGGLYRGLTCPKTSHPQEREIHEFATDVRNILHIVSHEVYNLWLFGWLSLDPLQRALRGLLARTLLDYRSKFEGDGMLDKWMAVFRNLDSHGVGNITADGLSIALRTLVNGAKVYEQGISHDSRLGMKSTNDTTPISQFSLASPGSTRGLIPSVQSWGKDLHEIDAQRSEAPSISEGRFHKNSTFASMTSSRRSSLSDSILRSRSSGDRPSVSKSLTEESGDADVSDAMGDDITKILRERTRSQSSMNGVSLPLEPPHDSRLDGCHCLKLKPHVLGTLGTSLGAGPPIEETEAMETDTDEGIQKMLKLFTYVDIEARGVLEPHVFLASVMDDSYLTNREVIEQLYNHIRCGGTMTVESLRHHIDWNTGPTSATLGIAPRTFWPSKQLKLDGPTMKQTELEVRRLFRAHGFCRSSSSPPPPTSASAPGNLQSLGCDANRNTGDNIQTISFETFAKAFASATLDVVL